jgi:hypothetical protein
VLDIRIHSHYPTIFYHHWKTRDLKNADADRGSFGVQEFLHYHGDVPAYRVLWICWSYSVRDCEIRGGAVQVCIGVFKKEKNWSATKL